MNNSISPQNIGVLSPKLIQETEKVFRKAGISKGTYMVFFETMGFNSFNSEDPAVDFNGMLQKLIRNMDIQNFSDTETLLQQVMVFHMAVVNLTHLWEIDLEKFDAVLGEILLLLEKSHGGSPDVMLAELSEIASKAVARILAEYTDIGPQAAAKEKLNAFYAIMDKKSVKHLLDAAHVKEVLDKNPKKIKNKDLMVGVLMKDLVYASCALDQLRRKDSEKRTSPRP